MEFETEMETDDSREVEEQRFAIQSPHLIRSYQNIGTVKATYDIYFSFSKKYN